MPSRNLTFTRRDWLIALVVILLAFGYRLVIIADRATAPNEIARFDPLPQGTDQRTYYNQLLGFGRGEYPPDTFFYQPGLPYFLRFASLIMRTTNLGALRIFTAALAAINCGLMIAVGRLVSGQRSVGILSGLLLAVYPVSAFYDTDFVITAQATILATLALFGALWLWRSPHQWSGAVLLGLSTGAAAVTRLEVTILAPVWALWLISIRRDWRTIAQVVLAALIAVAVLAPTVLHNQRGGANYLITPVGPKEIYRGNNRDVDGTRGPSIASDSTHFDYLQYLAKDIALEPARFAELVAHKVALFLSDTEPGNNLSFVTSGKQISPALAWNPLNFTMLLTATLYGIFMLLKERHRPVVVLLTLGFIGIMGMVLLIWVEARLRTPVIVLMIPAAAYGILHLMASLHTQPLRRVLRDALPAIVGISVVLLLVRLGVEQLPRKLTVRTLPADAVATHLVYDDTLELVGWQTREQYSPQSIIAPFTPYVVTLYWRLNEPTATDYSVALKYLVDGQQIIGLDSPIGDVVFPYRRTSQWDTGIIYVEHIGISYRRFDGPVEQSGTLALTVYPERDFAAELPAVSEDGSEYAAVILGQPAIRFGDGRTDFADSTRNIAFGDVLRLQGWQVPPTAAPGETITITAGWQTTSQRMMASYAIALFLFQDDNYIANVDSPPHQGDFLTRSIPPDYRFDDSKSLTLPNDPGRYEVRIGVYDQASVTRLPVADGIDNLYPIGQIIVK